MMVKYADNARKKPMVPRMSSGSEFEKTPSVSGYDVPRLRMNRTDMLIPEGLTEGELRLLKDFWDEKS